MTNLIRPTKLHLNELGRIAYKSVARCIHNYRNTVPWGNTLELSQHLINSVIYHDNDLLVLNKPYGITFSREDPRKGPEDSKQNNANPMEMVFKKQSKQANHKFINSPYFTSGVVSDSLNLIDCLPHLKKHFGYDKLHIARVPEKYVSGVAILTSSNEMVESVIKNRFSTGQTGKDRYLIVVAGVPRYQQGKVKIGFTLESNQKKGKRVVLLQKWSNRAYKRGEIRIGTFHHQTICSGIENLTSLVEVRVDLRKYHAYRVFCADYLLSPVLGDNLFASRVQTVMGVPMRINHFSDAANVPQKLPNEVYNLLGLTSAEASIIPVHVHLADMLLTRFLKEKKSLLLKAPPPPYFQWSCEKLGLIQPQQVLIAAN